MSDTVKIEEFTDKLKEALLDVKEDVDEIVIAEVDNVIKKAKADLVIKSPRTSGAPSRGKQRHYADSWRLSRVTRNKNVYSRKVEQSTENRPITHLLELGHISRDGVTWTNGIPHIIPIQKKWRTQFNKNIKRKLK